MKNTSAAPTVPSPALWLAITLLWGTVFYATSVYMLRLASQQLAGGLFDPSGEAVLNVYGMHAVLLVSFALIAMTARMALDPGANSQIRRWEAVKGGYGEKVFISLSGSIATGFFFTILTALTWTASSELFPAGSALSLSVVFLASFYNIGAGLSASLLVGLVFFLSGIGKKA
ncbi:hypothetical protein [Pelodictyon luteolum]|uniref:Uncharacterized protein n=1 Tax=Chlorobium luteolum (strain DSM 273 / BCRC 81028 / 2530) TaxID=319225 RepID=Q3B5R7_CHLL3|nr:hypothetical protein [Pelodictyon luteolum]ABB23314.1 conserved hypothetical protein [Pelodictyon luteolum DSM 273]